METQETTNIKARIAELRQRFAKLKALCGLQGINQTTIAEYAQQIRSLELQLN